MSPYGNILAHMRSYCSATMGNFQSMMGKIYTVPALDRKILLGPVQISRMGTQVAWLWLCVPTSRIWDFLMKSLRVYVLGPKSLIILIITIRR